MEGRLILLKSTLSSIPIYYMSLFRMPNCVMTKIEGLMRRFLWSGKDNGRARAKVAWDKLYLSFDNGGLNIKTLQI